MNLSTRILRMAAGAAIIAFLAFAWAQQGAPPAEAAFVDSDGDGAIDIAEEVSSSDPDDPESTPENTGVQFLTGIPVCSDGVDNDGDGPIDLADPGCTDTDGDIVPDDVEAFVGSDPNDSASFPEDSRIDAIVEFYGIPFNFCGDLVDNDLDGATDGDDPGCTPIRNDGDEFDDATEKQFGSDPANANSVPEHELPNPGSCTDGIDNDLDGATDAADPACGVPDNDDRAAATVISSLPFSSGPVVAKNASVEPGEPQPSCAFGGLSGSVWYRHTAGADGVLIADTIGSNVDTVLAVWRDDGGDLSQVACDYGYDGEEYQARAAFAVEAGGTYLFQVQAFPFTANPKLAFNLVEGNPPANDGYANATVIGGLPFSESVETDAATVQFGEPTPPCGYYPLQSTVWYEFTPASNMLLIADTSGSDFLTTLGVYAETKFGLTPVDCAASNVFYGGPDEETVIGARLALNAVAGRTYYIQIGGGFEENFGKVLFTLEIGTAPPNDDFANAATIAGLPYEDEVDLLTASGETGEPAPNCFFAGSPDGTVWYRLTAPRDLLVEVAAENTAATNTFIAVYQGSELDDLRAIACGNPYEFYPDTRLGFQAEDGESYYIQMGMATYGYPFAAGDAPDVAAGMLTITVSEIDLPPCGEPDFTFADPLGDTRFSAPPPPPPLTSPDFPPPPPTGPVPHDITTIAGGRTDDYYCLTVNFDDPIDPPNAGTPQSVYTYIDFDLDEDTRTGYQGEINYACGQPSHLGTDLGVRLSGSAGILVPLYTSLSPPPPDGGLRIGYALSGERSVTLVLPMDALTVELVTDAGGPEAFNFALFVVSGFGPVSDCAPNGGFIHAPDPAHPGDVNCDGTTNAIDTAIILQMVAGLLPGVPCPWVGDVNGTGILGPIDALLILQFDAGLLPELELPAVG